MDTFMEKLAHRLTAQEMIKANTAAEAEELMNLKNQVRDYHECLDQMQNLVNEGTEQIRGLKSSETESYKIIQNNMSLLFEAVDAAGEKTSQQNIQAIEELKRFVSEKMATAGREDDSQTLEALKQFMSEMNEKMEAAGRADDSQTLEALRQFMNELSAKLEELKQTGNEDEENARRQEELGMLFGAVDAAGEKTSQQNIQAIESLKQFLSEKLEELKQKDEDEERGRLEEELERLFSAVNATSERTVRQNGQDIEELKHFISQKLDESSRNQDHTEQLKHFIDAKIQGLQEDKESSGQLETIFAEKLDESQEKVHKECVKVYRNVQAAMAEELEKQNTELGTQVRTLKQRLGIVTIVAGVSAVFGLVSMILQILAMVNSSL